MISVTIIGSGVVGQAVGKGFARMGLDVTFYDVNKEVLEKLKGEGYQTSETILKKSKDNPYSDYHIICVPEKFVEEVVLQVYGGQRTASIIIKSTVPVGTTWHLWNRGINVFHNPEFLVEVTAERDFLEPNIVVLGSPDIDGRYDRQLKLIAEDLYWWVEPNKIIYTDSNISEMVKLALNGYLSTIIGYWNDIHRICEKLGINSHEVGRICSRDPRVTEYGSHRHGKKVGGACLPKDSLQLIELAKSVGVTNTLIEKVREKDM